jgi:tRNA-modifying protein YgfZ
MVNLLYSMIISGSAAVFHYRPACLLRVTGSDAATFLQSQFTNDLRDLKPAGAVYGLWLDRKGRVIADSHVLRDPGAEAFWVASLSSPATVVARHLGDHIIADEVEVADETGGWRGVSLLGAGVGAWLAGEPRPGLVFPGRRASSENWEWLARDADSAPVAAAVSGARVLDAAEVERLRIESAIPSVPADIGPADIPNEGGLDEQAISYSKGCYLGQEVMARIRSTGRVRRRLVRVRGGGAPPALPAGLWRGDRREGEIRSAVVDGDGFIGLALVSAGAASEGGPLASAQGGAPAVEVLAGR